MRERLTAFFPHDDALRSRSVGGVVHAGTVDVPAPPARLLSDWERDIGGQLGLEPGDVESLPLARARVRWPDYRHCVQAASGWMRALGLPGVLDASEIALMACRGARYHHDGLQYGGSVFCNLFVSDDKGLDVHFAATGDRIALARGTMLLFDTCQPHAVVRRGAYGFDAAHFAPGIDCSQVFLTWEIPLAQPDVAQAMGIALDTAPQAAALLDGAQLQVDGRAMAVCPATGRWRAA